MGNRLTYHLTCNPGVSIPAVTIRFEIIKDDMRKGRKTGSPVSVEYQRDSGSTGAARTRMKGRVQHFLGLP